MRLWIEKTIITALESFFTSLKGNSSLLRIVRIAIHNSHWIAIISTGETMVESLFQLEVGHLNICLFDRLGQLAQLVAGIQDTDDVSRRYSFTLCSSGEELDKALSSGAFDALMVVNSGMCARRSDFALLGHQNDSDEPFDEVWFRPLKTGDVPSSSRGGVVQRVLYRFVYGLTAESFVMALDEIANEIERQKAGPLLVNLRNGAKVLHPRQIIFVESDRRVLFIHLEHEVLRVYGKLSELLEKLPLSFVHCHKSFLINMDYVDELSGEHVTMTTGDVVPMSQKRRRATRESLEAYLGRTL